MARIHVCIVRREEELFTDIAKFKARPCPVFHNGQQIATANYVKHKKVPMSDITGTSGKRVASFDFTFNLVSPEIDLKLYADMHYALSPDFTLISVK